MSTYVFGDIQGCDAELGELLALIQFNPQKDRAYFVGDLVNRGPESAEVLRRIKSLQEMGAAESVLGNHDFFLIMAQAGLAKPHPGDTLDQVLNAPDAIQLVDWLRNRPLIIEHENTLIFHAGVFPSWTPADAHAAAREIERELRAPNYLTFLQTLFGNDPNTWHADLKGAARARAIVNALARMRFCTPFSEMEFKEKRDSRFAAEAGAGFLPWFRLPNRQTAQQHVVAGHWSSEGLRLLPNVSLLDSGCLWGGSLSALRLEDRALFQVGSQQALSLGAD